MHHPDLAGTPQHARHDPNLIAGFAADDLVSADRTRARALLESCTECRALHDDLLALTRATRTLPPVAAPRDFRLTAEQASRLRRRTGWLARLLGPFGATGTVVKPLATTLTTLGFVGVLVASAAGGMLGGAASMAAPESAPGPAAGGVTAGSVASAAPGMQFGPAASPEDRDATKDNADATVDPFSGQAVGGHEGNAGNGGTEDGRAVAQNPPPNLFLLGSFTLLAAGLLLFGLRFLGRRVR